MWLWSSTARALKHWERNNVKPPMVIKNTMKDELEAFCNKMVTLETLILVPKNLKTPATMSRLESSVHHVQRRLNFFELIGFDSHLVPELKARLSSAFSKIYIEQPNMSDQEDDQEDNQEDDRGDNREDNHQADQEKGAAGGSTDLGAILKRVHTTGAFKKSTKHNTYRQTTESRGKWLEGQYNATQLTDQSQMQSYKETLEQAMEIDLGSERRKTRKALNINLWPF
jgi:hypothetical protein